MLLKEYETLNRVLTDCLALTVVIEKHLENASATQRQSGDKAQEDRLPNRGSGPLRLSLHTNNGCTTDRNKNLDILYGKSSKRG